MEPDYRPFLGRRPAREVRIGTTAVGGNNPIRIQSMLTSDTMDTAACVKETLGLVEVGCEIVRITAPSVKDATNLGSIRAALRQAGCTVPLVADIHFKPEAALEAALWVDKVRINPGNFADTKKFNVREYTDSEYEAEIGRIRDRFFPLVRLCKERGVAMRIGTNHGSLSDRIMNRFGDTPLGMVESALEFASIARELDYHELVFSMKSSNPKVMIQAYRLLVSRLEALSECEDVPAGAGRIDCPQGSPNGRDERERASQMQNAECGMIQPRDSSISNSTFPISNSSWNYPIHLGVTEAGDGEDGRIKSAIGIGSLLADGIGDTIRVSLTEDSIHEIPVARELVRIAELRRLSHLEGLPFTPFSYARRSSEKISAARIPTGGDELVRVAVHRRIFDSVVQSGDFKPEIVCEDAGLLEVDPSDESAVAAANSLPDARLLTVSDSCDLDVIPAFRLLASRVSHRHPILLKSELGTRNLDGTDNLLVAATNIGSLLCDGIGDAVLVQGDGEESLRIAYNILQAAGVRIFKTDYVACPSCGRTLFNLQDTTARIKAATLHLKGVKIAIMGCIVNGPGEMADADFGYVGGAPGKVNLYVGKTAVKFNVPEAEAVDRLVELIREHGRWFDPEPTA